MNAYTVKPKNLLTGQVLKTVYEVHGPQGIYVALDFVEEAIIVAYALNHGFEPGVLRCFSADSVARIKQAMSIAM